MYESLLFHGNRFATSSVVVKRQILGRIGGFSERPDFVGVEDYDLWLKLSRLGRFYFIDSVLGDYMIHDANFSSDIQTRANNWLNVLESHFRDLHPSGKFKKKIRSSKANVMFNAGWNNLKIGNFSDARQWFYRGLKLHPFSVKLYLGIIMAHLHIKVSKIVNSMAIQINNISRMLP